jgi:hypothetical protein
MACSMQLVYLGTVGQTSAAPPSQAPSPHLGRFHGQLLVFFFTTNKDTFGEQVGKFFKRQRKSGWANQFAAKGCTTCQRGPWCTVNPPSLHSGPARAYLCQFPLPKDRGGSTIGNSHRQKLPISLSTCSLLETLGSSSNRHVRINGHPDHNGPGKAMQDDSGFMVKALECLCDDCERRVKRDLRPAQSPFVHSELDLRGFKGPLLPRISATSGFVTHPKTASRNRPDSFDRRDCILEAVSVPRSSKFSRTREEATAPSKLRHGWQRPATALCFIASRKSNSIWIHPSRALISNQPATNRCSTVSADAWTEIEPLPNLLGILFSALTVSRTPLQASIKPRKDRGPSNPRLFRGCDYPKTRPLRRSAGLSLSFTLHIVNNLPLQ